MELFARLEERVNQNGAGDRLNFVGKRVFFADGAAHVDIKRGSDGARKSGPRYRIDALRLRTGIRNERIVPQRKICRIIDIQNVSRDRRAVGVAPIERAVIARATRCSTRSYRL